MKITWLWFWLIRDVQSFSNLNIHSDSSHSCLTSSIIYLLSSNHSSLSFQPCRDPKEVFSPNYSFIQKATKVENQPKKAKKQAEKAKNRPNRQKRTGGPNHRVRSFLIYREARYFYNSPISIQYTIRSTAHFISDHFILAFSQFLPTRTNKLVWDFLTFTLSARFWKMECPRFLQIFELFKLTFKHVNETFFNNANKDVSVKTRFLDFSLLSLLSLV